MNFAHPLQSNLRQMIRISRTLLLVLALVGMPALVLFSATSATAQNTNATIRGQVLDPTGALVPNAQVVVVNKDTNVTVFNGKTDSAGAFVAPQVIPGTYKITVTATGLKQSVIDNVIATVAQVASVNVNMELGQASETVTVSSKTEELDRSTSDISTLIAPIDVQTIPLVQRTTENLLAFIPGVTHGGAGDSVNTSQLSINGSRTLNTEVLLNGVSTIVASTGTPGTLPSPDAVDSFRVITTNAPAEYGRTSGGVITVNTKSGTNTYHGNLYFLFRNEDMDANTFFNKDTPANGLSFTPRPRDRFFQYGGSIGGAVRIPHLYNGRDKTFFFVNYDRTDSPSTTVLNETVPTLAQRCGDFSAALQTTVGTQSRAAQTVYMPGGTSTAAYPGNIIGTATTCEASNGQTPNSSLDPSAEKILLTLLPLPNTTGTFDLADNRYTNNWTSQQTYQNIQQKIAVRVDELVTPRDRVSFNVFRYTTSTPNAVTYNSALLNTTWLCTCNNAWLPSIDYTRTWSPTLVMDLNMGFFRNYVVRVPPGLSATAGQQLGISSLPLGETPEITDPGFSQIGPSSNTDQVNITNTYTPFGTITKVWGAHTFKTGASLRKNEFNSFNPATYPDGLIQFDGSITNHGASGNPNTGLADFVLGQIKTAQYEQVQPPTGRRNYNLGVFFQDDWKVSTKLTLNLGIRYEFESPLTIATNVYSRINPLNGQLLAAGINASRSLNIVTPKENVSPRIGLAYSVDSKTVLRAGFGTFYGTIFQNLGGQLAYPGFDNTITFNNLGTAIAQPFTLSQGIPIQAPIGNVPFGPVQAATASSPYSPAISFNNQNHMPLVQQWNFGFQRQLPFAVTLEANYVGNHALHLSYNLNENVVPLASVVAEQTTNTSLATQNASPFPALKQFTTNNDIGRSNYNALQVTVKRQFDKRLAVLSNYTYSKSMDDGSTIYNFSAPNGTANSQYPVDNANFIPDIAPSNIDFTHVLNIAITYTTPGPWWLRDWHISPVFVGRTGLPVNITQTSEIPGSSQRPNGNVQQVKLAHPFVTGNQLQYWDSPATDTTNFALTPSGPVFNTISGTRTLITPLGFGNVSRDAMRAPGEVDFDASVSKDFPIWERLKFQLRVDAFNVINHTNFTAPSGSLSVTETSAAPTVASFVTSSGFGRISGTQSPRQMQLSGRFFF